MKIRVLLADDHTFIRARVRSILENEPEIEVVGEAGTGQEAVDLALKLSPDVILMDYQMPHMNGDEATRIIQSKERQIRVLALSMHGDMGHVRTMFAAGAAGYILKDCITCELLSAVYSIADGRLYLCRELGGIENLALDEHP